MINIVVLPTDRSKASAEGRSLGLTRSIYPTTFDRFSEYLRGIGGYRPATTALFKAGNESPRNGGRSVANCFFQEE